MKLTDLIHYTKPLNRTGLFSSWKAQIGDLETHGKDQESVTRDIITQAREALSGYYEPYVIPSPSGTHLAVVYRNPWNGWGYHIQACIDTWRVGGYTCGFTSRDECITYARTHMQHYEE